MSSICEMQKSSSMILVSCSLLGAVHANDLTHLFNCWGRCFRLMLKNVQNRKSMFEIIKSCMKFPVSVVLDLEALEKGIFWCKN